MAEAREQQATDVFGQSCWHDHEIWQLHGSVKLKTLKFRPESVMNMAYRQSTTQLSLYHLKTQQQDSHLATEMCFGDACSVSFANNCKKKCTHSSGVYICVYIYTHRYQNEKESTSLIKLQKSHFKIPVWHIMNKLRNSL